MRYPQSLQHLIVFQDLGCHLSHSGLQVRNSSMSVGVRDGGVRLERLNRCRPSRSGRKAADPAQQQPVGQEQGAQ